LLLSIPSVVTDLLLDRVVLPSILALFRLALKLYDNFVFFGTEVRLAVFSVSLAFLIFLLAVPLFLQTDVFLISLVHLSSLTLGFLLLFVS
jgi:hypothetical protein